MHHQSDFLGREIMIDVFDFLPAAPPLNMISTRFYVSGKKNAEGFYVIS